MQFNNICSTINNNNEKYLNNFTGPGGLPAPTSVTVEGCAASPCHVSDGETIGFTVSFASGNWKL